MKLITSLVGSLAGIISVTIMHEVLGRATRGEKSKASKWMFVGADLVAGLVSAVVMHCVENRGRKKSIVSPYNPPVESYKPVIDITV